MRTINIILLIALIGLSLTLLSINHIHAQDATPTTTDTAATVGTVNSELRPETVSLKTDASEEILSQIRSAAEHGEKHGFQAEINQLLSIIINSLYTNKEIFLRELISNASDALDKIRFISLTDKKALDTNPDLKIQIYANKTTNTLVIRDTGIGMTKQDLINNLGTIARSGTKAFIEKLKAGSQESTNLIGQFGVGFYSAFLAADRVTVITKHNDDKQYIWESTADNNFVITEDPRGPTLGRGTAVVLHMKDDAREFLEDKKLRELVAKYSEFIGFPIELWTKKNETKEVPVLEDADGKEILRGDGKDTTTPPTTTETTKTEEKKETETDEVKVEDKKEEEKPVPQLKMKKVDVEKEVWEVLNENKPIWMRNPKDITKEEYTNFYKAISKDIGEFLTYIHFTSEGSVEFKALLFVPEHAPFNLFDMGQKTANIKLYVKRVFITDQINDLMPRYLNFIKGIVDSDDLPLNISRELLQHSKLLRAIKKRLVTKAISMFTQLAEKEIKSRKGEKVDSDEALKYSRLWKEYGKTLKLGIIEDEDNRQRLVKLLRFYSTKSEFQQTSLEEYVSRMKPGQKAIYYIAGESQDELRKSPFLEELNKRDLEVLYFTDPIDEYMIQHVKDFNGTEVISITREDLKFGDDTEKEIENLKKKFQPLTQAFKDIMGQKIIRADVGLRFTSADQYPCVVVATKYGYTANMVRIMKAQTLGNQEAQTLGMFTNAKIVEINPHHPVIVELNNRISHNKDDATAKSMVELLYETAALRSGYHVEDQQSFAERIFTMLKTGLHVDEESHKSKSTTTSTTDTSSQSEKNSHDEL